MAIITQKNLAKHSKAMSRNRTANYEKIDFYLALQAVVDLLGQASTRSAIDAAIEGVAPLVFNAPQKKRIFARAAKEMFRQESV